jgi:hypothetical protein
MRRAGVVILWLLAVVAGVVFLVLVVAPWLALGGVVTVPDLQFGRGGIITEADAASLTVAGSAGLFALGTVLLAVQTRRTALESHRLTRLAQEVLQSGHDHLSVGLQQVTVGQGLVEAANDQAAAGQRALEASFRPLMSDVPRGFWPHPGDGKSIEVVKDHFEHIDDEAEVLAGAEYGKPGYFSVALRNIGAGPAVVTEVKLHASDAAWDECTISAAVVPPGEVSRFTFTIPADRDDVVPIRNEILRSTSMVVTVAYTDQAGLHRMRTEAQLSRYRHSGGVSPWYVRQLSTFEGDGDQPVVKSAHTDPYGIPR